MVDEYAAMHVSNTDINNSALSRTVPVYSVSIAHTLKISKGCFNQIIPIGERNKNKNEKMKTKITKKTKTVQKKVRILKNSCQDGLNTIKLKNLIRENFEDKSFKFHGSNNRMD